MGFLFSLLLIVLGILAAESLVIKKVPAMKDVVAKLSRYKETFGIAGLLVGAVSFIEWIMVLSYFRPPVLLMGVALITTLLLFVLGLIFSLDWIRRKLSDPNAALLVKIDALRIKLLPFQQRVGVAAIVFGILHLFF